MSDKNEVAKKKVDWTSIDVQIERKGTAITLPNQPGEMPISMAIARLEQLQKDEEQEFEVSEVIQGFPLDAAAAFYKAMCRIYGWASAVTVQTIFGPQKPNYLTINTGPDPKDKIQVPIGRFVLPNMKNPVQAGFTRGEHGPVFFASGTVRKADRAALVDLANMAREILRTESLYRGKAFSLQVDNDGSLQVTRGPEFIAAPTSIGEGDVLFPRDIQRMLEVNLWAPIRHTAKVKAAGIPLRRGILLEGPYGTGKSLTARATAKVCIENGWTFINLSDARGLTDALHVAKIYAPAVIFAEDIDRVLGERDDDANDLVNTIDGVVSKTDEIMVVLTTNHLDKIEQVMLRPGRLDAIISFRAPDADTAVRLVHLYGRDLIRPGEDMSPVGEVLAGLIPATIREVVERAKLAMIADETEHLTADAILVAAQTMKAHIDLLAPRPDRRSAGDRLVEALQAALNIETSDYDLDMLQMRINDNTDGEASDTRSLITKKHNDLELQVAKMSTETKALIDASIKEALHPTRLREVLKQVAPALKAG